MFTISEPIPGCEDFGYFCRPSVGPSSIAWYDGEVPELRGRLLSTALKHGSIYAFDPAAGEGAGFTRYYLGQNRLRDIEIADGGRTIYLLTDSQGGVQTPEGEGGRGAGKPRRDPRLYGRRRQRSANHGTGRGARRHG
ncbi:PQQ-dependent sugar dehydrogenase [Paracoccus luteus]|uniref:PQQ-dependent sugar dehydrogenase n=1 Tax=Paracoccus luteus TaxID=2508543 RepID=UPI001FE9E148|nr:PQQ-dependent sugar dehydrogenase [Paracoccus luteus]